jgi:hypothetical protein
VEVDLHHSIIVGNLRPLVRDLKISVQRSVRAAPVQDAGMSFLPRCYFCRRVIWWLPSLTNIHGSTGWHVAHRSCWVARARRPNFFSIKERSRH